MSQSYCVRLVKISIVALAAFCTIISILVSSSAVQLTLANSRAYSSTLTHNTAALIFSHSLLEHRCFAFSSVKNTLWPGSKKKKWSIGTCVCLSNNVLRILAFASDQDAEITRYFLQQAFAESHYEMNLVSLPATRTCFARCQPLQRYVRVRMKMSPLREEGELFKETDIARGWWLQLTHCGLRLCNHRGISGTSCWRGPVSLQAPVSGFKRQAYMLSWLTGQTPRSLSSVFSSFMLVHCIIKWKCGLKVYIAVLLRSKGVWHGLYESGGSEEMGSALKDRPELV